MTGHYKGIVTEIGEGGQVKVRLPEYDDLITDWLPVVQHLTLGARTWAVPRVDTQVIVLPGLGTEDAVVLGAIYSQEDPPSFEDSAVIGMTADDGVCISYDPGASKLTIESPKLIKITATNIEIEADIKITGDSDITGGIKHSGDMEQTGNAKRTGTLEQTGAASITGDTKITGSAVITMEATIGPASTKFTSHYHSPGVPFTTPPVPGS